jgi:hypothetical protein
MAITDLNTNQQVIELLPPDKRYPNSVSWLQTCLKSTIQWLWAGLNEYMNGSTAPTWIAGAYPVNATVIYNKSEYISLNNGNADTPGLSTKWYLVNSYFIGVNDRVKYNGQTITLTFALNKYFRTTFRQPGAGTSDIYLTTTPNAPKGFISGGSNSISSISYLDHSSEVSNDSQNSAVTTNLTVNVPVAVYNALATNNTDRSSIILSFVNKYIYAGISSQVITY